MRATQTILTSTTESYEASRLHKPQTCSAAGEEAETGWRKEDEIGFWRRHLRKITRVHKVYILMYHSEGHYILSREWRCHGVGRSHKERKIWGERGGCFHVSLGLSFYSGQTLLGRWAMPCKLIQGAQQPEEVGCSRQSFVRGTAWGCESHHDDTASGFAMSNNLLTFWFQSLLLSKLGWIPIAHKQAEAAHHRLNSRPIHCFWGHGRIPDKPSLKVNMIWWETRRGGSGDGTHHPPSLLSPETLRALLQRQSIPLLQAHSHPCPHRLQGKARRRLALRRIQPLRQLRPLSYRRGRGWARFLLIMPAFYCVLYV